MATTKELVVQYREYSAAMKEREKAEIEYKLWDLAPPESRVADAHARENYLVSLVDGNQHDHRKRAYLYNAGPAADILWERVERDYALNTAVYILQAAKKTRLDLSENALREAIATGIREYDSRPQKRILQSGKVARARSPIRLPTLQEAIKPFRRKKPPVDAREFWDELRKLIASHVGPRLATTPKLMQDRLYKEFEMDLKVLIDAMQNKITRLSKQDGGILEVHRKHVTEACRTLSMDPPKPNKPVDLTQARKLQRKLARHYHPDTNGGDASLSSLYQQVMKAYETLEEYNESLNK